MSTTAAPVAGLRALASRPLVLWTAFVLVHVLVSAQALLSARQPMGDVTAVYPGWVQRGLDGDGWVGVDVPWVYPLLALLPMLLSLVAGVGAVAEVWLVLVLVLDVAAFAVLRRVAPSPGPAWGWIAFLALLGPIALVRVDAVTVPVALVGALLLLSRPALAGVVLAVGAWTKVWPAALVLAGALALRGRGWWRVLAGAGGTSGVVVAVSLALGSGATVFGPITQQSGRGLQLESPLATLALWRVALGVPGSRVYFDHEIITYQVAGDGVALAARLGTPLMALAVLGVLLLAWRALRAGAGGADLLSPLATALVVALIVTNKVGSPQFVAWLAVPTVLGLVLVRRGGPPVALPTALALAAAALTQVVYPEHYDALVTAQPWMVTVITVRVAVELAMLVVACRALWRAAGGAGRAPRTGPGQSRGDSTQNSLPSGSASTTQVSSP
ncbi:hypothetical protein [Frigoribacterium salinisoli]